MLCILKTIQEHSEKLQDDWYKIYDLDNKNTVLELVRRDKRVLFFLSEKYRNDQDVVLLACTEDVTLLRYASRQLKNDKNFALSILDKKSKKINKTRYRRNLSNDDDDDLDVGSILIHFSDRIKSDKDVVTAACARDGMELMHASDKLRSDRAIVLTACANNGQVLQYALEDFRADHEIVLAACKTYGPALEHASETLRANKEIVLAATTNNSIALKYALNGLNQDPDCLVAAKLWDENYDNSSMDSIIKSKGKKATKIVLSTKFSLDANSSPLATLFTIMLKANKYIQQRPFVVYSPNAFSKDTCDPEWTRMEWPCRGTIDTCRKESKFKTGMPQLESCWRYSYRYQLEQAKSSNGIMVQIVDHDVALGVHTLGKGQEIESAMAKDVGIKTFRVYPDYDGVDVCVADLIFAIKCWYEKDNCHDMNESDVPGGDLKWCTCSYCLKSRGTEVGE